ncbi:MULTISPECIES: hypothetical protein [unclassified Nocardioides]|uniref:hypothetical protein n=1 Tax=unclassified Nocardioides TaxID=2615069 RepID=UPI000B2C7FE5|nr:MULTISPECIES: hypothetical protein [unclassified Nocardioides]
MGQGLSDLKRPQPLGLFPLPAGYLLIPASTDPAVDETRAQLASGNLPQEWPAALAAHQLAHAGDLDGAYAAFGDDEVGAFNRYVIDPTGVDRDALRASLPQDLAPLVDVIAYACGLSNVPPEEGETTGEVLALIRAARATSLLEAGDPAGAVDVLNDAAEAAEPVSAPLAAILLGNGAVIAHDHALRGADPINELGAVLKVLQGTDVPVARAELHLQRGLCLHELAATGRRPLTDAVDEYYSALQLVGQASAPQVWASANLNLGTAYLTMPMVEASDQLRAGIAMQALRGALEVFTQEDFPQEWASAQMNLANALVYTPSTHQGDNIVEAVERYEEVLEMRERQGDPLGRARILANQGNALAHLGVFDHAKSKLYEARFLFEEQGDVDAVLTVRSVLDEIAKQVVPGSQGPRFGVPQGEEVELVRELREQGVES